MSETVLDDESLASIRFVRDAGRLELLDQRRLPHERRWVQCSTVAEVAAAIEQMVVRGAPAIAVAASYGLAIAVRAGDDREAATTQLLGARPTAVNIRWALERLAGVPDDEVEAEAIEIHAEDTRINRALGDAGAHLLRGGVLTICNTGTLATGGYGTALGMIRSAWLAHGDLHVYALETRPYLQGARLTAFELMADGIPCTLITDGMAAAAMASGRVSSVVVGCDRVAANGDVANKIGTLQTAVLAKHYGLPCYVAMPTSTLDRNTATGADIVIEERSPDEVRGVQGHLVAPSAVPVWNPAFDVTPAELVAGWVTEKGVWRPPFPSE